MNGFQVFIDVVVTVGVVFYAIGQFKNGKDKTQSTDLQDAKNTVQLYQSRIALLEGQVKELQVGHKEDYENIIRLQEQLKHKDEQIKQYLDILQNRDPELKEFMKTMNETLPTLTQGIKQLLETHNLK